MKTFKLMTFDLITEDGKKNIPLTDGLIINQENIEKTWVLELFISKAHRSIFEQLHTSGQPFDAYVVISFPDNEPAPFTVSVCEIHEIGENISVLMKGKVRQIRKKYAEQLLKVLLEENLSKEELINRFEQSMKERPRLKES